MKGISVEKGYKWKNYWIIYWVIIFLILFIVKGLEFFKIFLMVLLNLSDVFKEIYGLWFFFLNELSFRLYFNMYWLFV